MDGGESKLCHIPTHLRYNLFCTVCIVWVLLSGSVAIVLFVILINQVSNQFRTLFRYIFYAIQMDNL